MLKEKDIVEEDMEEKEKKEKEDMLWRREIKMRRVGFVGDYFWLFSLHNSGENPTNFPTGLLTLDSTQQHWSCKMTTGPD